MVKSAEADFHLSRVTILFQVYYLPPGVFRGPGGMWPFSCCQMIFGTEKLCQFKMEVQHPVILRNILYIAVYCCILLYHCTMFPCENGRYGGTPPKKIQPLGVIRRCFMFGAGHVSKIPHESSVVRHPKSAGDLKRGSCGLRVWNMINTFETHLGHLLDQSLNRSPHPRIDYFDSKKLVMQLIQDGPSSKQRKLA